jgi:hypothetical protein
MIGVTYTMTEPSPISRMLDLVKRPEQILKPVGRRGANELKKHFLKRQQTPNKLGGSRSNYWRRVGQSVQNPQVRQLSVVISINDPTFAQKVYGGPIRPKRAGALTIPVDPLAYDRSAKTFQQETGLRLFLLKGRVSGGSFLAAKAAAGGIHIYYELSKGVNQKPDPEALPDRQAFWDALLDTATKAFSRAALKTS